MTRFTRSLSATLAHAATFASLITLSACGSNDEPGSDVPSYEGTQPQATNPLAPSTPEQAANPNDGANPPPLATPPGEQNPTGVPLTPPDTNTPPTNTNPPANENPPPVTAPPGQPPAFAENTSAACTVPTLPNANALPAIDLLPDPFLSLATGQRITTKDQWTCRRQEIRAEAERYIYGSKPTKPESVTGSVTNNLITVNVSNQGKTTRFTVGVELPTTGSAPYPALVSVGLPPFAFSQNPLVKNEGVAVIAFDPYAIGAEGTPRNNKAGAFYDIYGNQSSTGLLLAWSWGVSRILDVIAQSDGSILKAEATAVAGCSRFGKAAFTIGAFDDRIALTIPFESGSGGVPIWRGIPGEGAQTPQAAFTEQPWLGDAFGSFSNGVTRLPVDTHEVVSMIAPRGLLILDNPHITNLGPISAHVAAQAGAEVFKALGVGANISYHSAVASGMHCQARPEHEEPIRQNLRKFLLKTGNAPGAITAAAKGTGNLTQWRTWSTPTLQ